MWFTLYIFYYPMQSVHQKSVGGKVVSDRAWEFECRKTRLPPSTLERNKYILMKYSPLNNVRC